MPLKNIILKQDLAGITSADIDWLQFNNKTVLITGASGFLPAYMVETLLYLNNNYDNFNVSVIALVRNKEKAISRFTDYKGDDHLVFIEQDVCSEISIQGPVDFIIHAASQASPKYYGIDPVGTLSANVLGTINLMKLAQVKNVTSFLYFSSGEIYGQLDDSAFPVVEDNYGYIDPLKV
ncbi:MAG: NAD-dependent epimerase/dehydratase family protein, partial [Ferruginibacter sp.]